MGNKIEIETDPKKQDVAIVHDGLMAHNKAAAVDARYKRLTIFLRDETDAVVGGLVGETYWDWLYVETLWVDEILRHKGYATELMATAEAEALARGCKHSFLDTFSFQARSLYEGLGYEVFGVLDEYPGEHKRFFMRKTLAPGASESAPNI
jgi:predicted GNAT family acetyltransferase